MAANNKSEYIINNCLDKSKNKVYINPNFTKSSVYDSSAVTYVNPRFSHLLSSVPHHNKPRIFVNPNFNKINNCVVDNNEVNINQQKIETVNLITPYPTSNEQRKHKISASVSKSRYCIVRQNTPKVCEVPNVPIVDKSRNTYQVNKYKSIPLKDIKKNLDNAKNSINVRLKASCIDANTNSSTTSSSGNRFKVVNNVATVVKNNKVKTRTLVDTHKKALLVSQPRLKKIKAALSKNNIPCPMFRKYGKCLRTINGKCRFVHDKKHVSICRKFIKGLCFDKNCLLSHDLTTKKMPTCFFYLQGTCTKPDCPYLHVKLNEKAKICSDFLKGYCEKGSKCSQRHIDVITNKKVKGSSPTRSIVKRNNTAVKGKNKLDNDCVQSDKSRTVTEKNDIHLDCRYYQELKEDVSETCEVIKPMRCKLGTLPSFIQL